MVNETRTYRRGQVEWALWRQYKAEMLGFPTEAPTPFATRIKRLLDLDRPIEPDFDEIAFAFSDTAPPGKGVEAEFSAFDAFCLALGLDMLDAGFKQSEVVFVLKQIRPDLRKQHAKIIARRLKPDRSISRARDHPDLPSFKNQRGTDIADWRVFIVLRRLDIPGGTMKIDSPAFLEPIVADGIEGLADALNEKMWPFRKAYLAEIAKPASLTAAFLEQAPEIRRGRP